DAWSRTSTRVALAPQRSHSVSGVIWCELSLSTMQSVHSVGMWATWIIVLVSWSQDAQRVQHIGGCVNGVISAASCLAAIRASAGDMGNGVDMSPADARIAAR